MSATFTLSLDEYDHMAECGAFDHLDRKVELIRGELRQMNPVGPIHDELITYLNNWSIGASADGIRVTAQTGLRLPDQTSRPEPDLIKKMELYAEAGITEYWIADANASCIHVCREPAGTAYEDRSIVKPGDFLSPQAHPESRLDVADLFADE